MRVSERLLRSLIARFELDLSGLSVYTEAASGAYLYTPILAALAGARRVYARTRDSRYGLADDVERATAAAAQSFGVASRIEVVRTRRREDVQDADIVTNSGFVRPLDAEMISWMKPTAVVPLMWETWEFRERDLDLQACREHGILVLGTNESGPPCHIAPYFGFLAVKLLFELELEGFGTRVALLGGPRILAGTIFDFYRSAGIDVTWFGAPGEAQLAYEELPAWFETHAATIDAIIVAEHHDRRLLLGGSEALLSDQTLADANGDVRIGVIAGTVDAAPLRERGIIVYPDAIQPPGFMSYLPDALGPRPVLELYTGGLKVGEAMARARLRGLRVEDAATFALANSPAMDFQGDLAWVSGTDGIIAGGQHGAR